MFSSSDKNYLPEVWFQRDSSSGSPRRPGGVIYISETQAAGFLQEAVFPRRSWSFRVSAKALWDDKGGLGIHEKGGVGFELFLEPHFCSLWRLDL